MFALGQKRPFRPSQPNVRFAPKAVIRQHAQMSSVWFAIGDADHRLAWDAGGMDVDDALNISEQLLSRERPAGREPNPVAFPFYLNVRIAKKVDYFARAAATSLGKSICADGSVIM